MTTRMTGVLTFTLDVDTKLRFTEEVRRGGQPLGWCCDSSSLWCATCGHNYLWSCADEDVADNIFNTDPYYQQGGDMVRVGGMSYRIDVSAPMGSRISELALSDTGEAIEAGKSYTVAGWASVNEGTEGPQIWDVIESHIRKLGTVDRAPSDTVTVVGA